jgi:CubicO group peptidase (beta-lactamase class C family)
MHYGCSTDLLGFLIARIEGAPLGAVLRRRIFDPLGMNDTGFFVPRGKWDRRAAAYGFDEAGRLTKRATLLGTKPFAVGRGFGLGIAIVMEPDKTDWMRRGSPGTVSWRGALGGWWQADPRNGLVLIFLAHNIVDLKQMAKGIGLGVWAAVETFQTLACD